MKFSNFRDKKIGIWGFGVVGKSAARYLVSKFVKSYSLSSSTSYHKNIEIEVLDKRELKPEEIAFFQENNIKFVDQKDPEALNNFLEKNDLIIPSPGVDLRQYKKYSNKFISEFDIFQDGFEAPIIAITGTVGKTTITHMLDQIIKSQKIEIFTGGNIGTPVLDVLTSDKKEFDMILLELSSFQLELCKSFAPTLAIWTNLFPNHLDKHSNMEEYFMAKLQIIANQKCDQSALLPLNLIDKLLPEIKRLKIKSRLNFFSEHKPDQEILEKLNPSDTVFYLGTQDGESEAETVFKMTLNKEADSFKITDTKITDTKITGNKITGSIERICSISHLKSLAEFTFAENLLIIAAALHIFGKTVNRTYALCDTGVKDEQTSQGSQDFGIQKTPNFSPKLLLKFTNLSDICQLDLSGITPFSCQVEHRLEKFICINGVDFYNDSKATTTTSTLAAVKKLYENKKPIILLLGGLGKGVDRSPMIKELKSYVKFIINFGKEAELLQKICEQEQIPSLYCKTMEDAVYASFTASSPGDQVALSPSGTSYDLFKDYLERGREFKRLILETKVTGPQA